MEIALKLGFKGHFEFDECLRHMAQTMAAVTASGTVDAEGC